MRDFTSTDPEGEGIHWDVTGVDADDFYIDARGMLMFRSPPDYEDPTAREKADDQENTDVLNLYSVTVRATEMMGDDHEGRALSSMTEVMVQVTNKDEDGSISLDRVQPEVGVAIAATLEDPDGVTTPAATYQWYVSKVSEPDAGTPTTGL